MRNFRRLVLFCSVFIFYVLAPTERSPFFLLLPRFGIRLLRAHSFFSLRFWLSVYFIHHPNRVSFYLASVLLAAWERKPSGDVWQCRPLRCLHGVWLLSVSLFFFLFFFVFFGISPPCVSQRISTSPRSSTNTSTYFFFADNI